MGARLESMGETSNKRLAIEYGTLYSISVSNTIYMGVFKLVNISFILVGFCIKPWWFYFCISAF